VSVSQLCFCQLLFEFVYSWKSFHTKNKKGELFIQTQSTSNTLADDFTRKTVVVKSHLRATFIQTDGNNGVETAAVDYLNFDFALARRKAIYVVKVS